MTHQTQSTVLVVDDEPAITQLLSIILQGENRRVISAQDGFQAIDILAHENIDVVVTDIMMDGVSGFEILEHIKEHDDNIQVIMMTGHESNELVKRALRGNAYDYLNKPLTNHEEIVSTVERAYNTVRLTRENSKLLERVQKSNLKLNSANKRLLQLNKQLRKLAITDSLTQLHNRRYIDDWIQNYAFSNTSLEASYSVLLLDIDHFKNINDSLGHDSGDKVLRHLASVLKNINRDSDLVGRYGGEEFIVVMPGTDETEALTAAEKIRSMVEAASINVSSGTVQITVSIGVSTNLTGVTASMKTMLTPAEAFFSGRALVAQADKALYAAKDSGRNRCVHHNQLSDLTAHTG